MQNVKVSDSNLCLKMSDHPPGQKGGCHDSSQWTRCGKLQTLHPKIFLFIFNALVLIASLWKLFCLLVMDNARKSEVFPEKYGSTG